MNKFKKIAPALIVSLTSLAGCKKENKQLNFLNDHVEDLVKGFDEVLVNDFSEITEGLLEYAYFVKTNEDTQSYTVVSQLLEEGGTLDCKKADNIDYCAFTVLKDELSEFDNDEEIRMLSSFKSVQSRLFNIDSFISVDLAPEYGNNVYQAFADGVCVSITCGLKMEISYSNYIFTASIPETLQEMFGNDNVQTYKNIFLNGYNNVSHTPTTLADRYGFSIFKNYDPTKDYRLEITLGENQGGTRIVGYSSYNNFIVPNHNADIRHFDYDFEKHQRIFYSGNTRNGYALRFTGAEDDEWYDVTYGIFDLIDACKNATVEKIQNEGMVQIKVSGDFSFLKQLDSDITESANTSTFILENTYRGPTLSNEDFQINLTVGEEDGTNYLEEILEDVEVIDYSFSSFLNKITNSFEVSLFDSYYTGESTYYYNGTYLYDHRFIRELFNQSGEVEKVLIQGQSGKAYEMPLTTGIYAELSKSNIKEFVNPNNYTLEGDNIIFASNKEFSLNGHSFTFSEPVIIKCDEDPRLTGNFPTFFLNGDNDVQIRLSDNRTDLKDFENFGKEEIKLSPTLTSIIDWIQNLENYDLKYNVFYKENALYSGHTAKFNGNDFYVYQNGKLLIENGKKYIQASNDFDYFYETNVEPTNFKISLEQFLDYLKGLKNIYYEDVNNLKAEDANGTQLNIYFDADSENSRLSISTDDKISYIGKEISEFNIKPSNYPPFSSTAGKTVVPNIDNLLSQIADGNHSYEIAKEGSQSFVKRYTNGYKISDREMYVKQDGGFNYVYWNSTDHKWSQITVENPSDVVPNMPEKYLKLFANIANKVFPEQFNGNEKDGPFMHWGATEDGITLSINYYYQTNLFEFRAVENHVAYAARIKNIGTETMDATVRDHIIDTCLDRVLIEKTFKFVESSESSAWTPYGYNTNNTQKTYVCDYYHDAYEQETDISITSAMGNTDHQNVHEIAVRTSDSIKGAQSTNGGAWVTGNLLPSAFQKFTFEQALDVERLKLLLNSKNFEQKDGETNKFVLKDGVKVLIGTIDIVDMVFEDYAETMEFEYISENKFKLTLSGDCYNESIKMGSLTQTLVFTFDNISVSLPQ